MCGRIALGYSKVKPPIHRLERTLTFSSMERSRAMAGMTLRPRVSLRYVANSGSVTIRSDWMASLIASLITES